VIVVGGSLGGLFNAIATCPTPFDGKDARVARIFSTQPWILLGAVLFLVCLTVSALVVPELRLLHLLQAIIYIAVIVLARRDNPLGYGAGIAIAVVWNSFNLFVTHLIQAGAVAFGDFLRTGQVRRLETMMVTLAGVAHFILFAACLAALLASRAVNKKRKAVAGGVLCLAYFALIVAIARPE
jgi:hypothetical protein